MSSINMSRLGKDLLRGGVAPKYVKRILSELNAHFHDSKEQFMKEGATAADAELSAWNKIGTADAVLKEALAKPELKSFAWRFPKIVLVLGPTLIYLVSLAFTLLFLIATGLRFPELMSLDIGSVQSAILRASFEAMVFLLLHVIPLCIAIGIALFVKRRHIKSYLPVIGIVCMAFISSGWAYDIDWPTLSYAGEMSFNWGYSFFPRYIRGNHDLQNYFQILLALSLSGATWVFYRPSIDRAL